MKINTIIKQILLSVIFVFFSFTIHAQDTIYLNANKEVVPKDSSFQFIKIQNISEKGFNEKTFNLAGILISDHNYTDTTFKTRHGLSKNWNEDGKLYSSISYDNGRFNGFVKTFWPNGKPKRIDFFRNNIFQDGTCYDSLGNKVEHYDYQTMPQFSGGDAGLIKYIAENTKYPKEALDLYITGTVYIKFVVNKSGKISNVAPINKIDPILEKEALKVVYSMPDWKPGTQDAIPVDVWFIIPIKFNLQ